MITRIATRSQLDRTPTAELEPNFWVIIGKLEMNDIAGFGSSALADNDEA